MEEAPICKVAVRERNRPKVDPVILLAIMAIIGIVGWSSLPLANATGASDSDQFLLQTIVDPGIAVVPSNNHGSTALKLADITVPGQRSDASSTGWSFVNNSWFPGYGVNIRSVSDPALRGKNAVDGNGAADSFLDYTTGGVCPCTWNTSSFHKGVFGFSVTGSSNFVDSAKWGTSSALKYSGFSSNDISVASQTGLGTYSWNLYMRSELPEDAFQAAGSYRAKLIVSIYANT